MHLGDWRFSASQISSFLACERKYGWTYIVGVRGQPTPSQELGTRVHAMIEDYVQKGAPIDYMSKEGQIIGAGLQYLPTGEGLRAEREFEYRGRYTWRGYKDCERENEVWDWKTTSDLKWAKTPEDLMYDPQAILYAMENGASVVRLTWVYFQTKKTKKSLPVAVEMTADHACGGFGVMETIADEAHAVLAGAEGLDDQARRDYVLGLRYDASHCEAYGGCPFRGLCNLSPDERFKAKMSQAKGSYKMSLFDRMRKLNETESEVAINPPEQALAAPAQPLQTTDEYAAEQERVKRADAEAAAVKKAEKAKKKAEAKAEARDTIPAPPPAAPPVGLTVYLDCMPITSKAMLFESVVGEARKRIESSLGLADYRFAEYGQGPGILQQTVAQLLDEAPNLDALVVDTRVPEAQACLGLLKARAKSLVVRL